MRKYTADEISRMRRSLIYINTPRGVSFVQREVEERAERQLQTYMMAEIDPKDLEQQEQEMMRSYSAIFAKGGTGGKGGNGGAGGYIAHSQNQGTTDGRSGAGAGRMQGAVIPPVGESVVIQLVPTTDPVPPKKLTNKQEVLQEWWETCVAKYDGAFMDSDTLFAGSGGVYSLTFFVKERNLPISIDQMDMEDFLDHKRVKSEVRGFIVRHKRYKGITAIIHGNVRSGNYGT